MESRLYLSAAELNKTALEQFVYQPVGRDMIAYLAAAAQDVISCDTSLMPQPHQLPSPPRSPDNKAVQADDATLPTVEEFITQLVIKSNVQVPTLMSTLVYLTRLKAKLQPMARGLRCTTHRIFLAALILSAKYLNDSSPKNKHWANYTHVDSDRYSFGFTRTEVNLMEKQLLFLLEWDLRIDEHDLYRELDVFLEPLRAKIQDRHARKLRQREEKRLQREIYAQAAARYPSPPSSRGHSRSRQTSPEHHRAASGGSISPPGLIYSSSASSYTPSIASSRQHSRATTPLESDPEPEPYLYEASQGSLYDSPVEVMLEAEAKQVRGPSPVRMLPYEISADDYRRMHDESAAKKRQQQKRGMWGRLLGGAVAVR